MSKGLLMKYVYQVIYYECSSLYCKNELEHEIFSSLLKAKQFLLKIVKEENRRREEKDFYLYKIKIIKKKLNVLEEDEESDEYIYDLLGKKIFPLNTEYDFISTEIENIEYQNGTIVKIMPYPWNSKSSVEIPILGVIGGIFNNEYIIYVIDCFKIVHLHVNKICIQKIDNIEKVDKSLLKLSQYTKNDTINELELKEFSFEL